MSKKQMSTPFTKRLSILSDLYVHYRESDSFKEFAEYNDLGLPLSHVCAVGLAEIKPEGKNYIWDTYILFAKTMGLDPDDEFENIDEMIDRSQPVSATIWKLSAEFIPHPEEIYEAMIEGVDSDEISTEVEKLIKSIAKGEPSDSISLGVFNLSNSIVAMMITKILPLFLDEKNIDDEFNKANEYNNEKVLTDSQSEEEKIELTDLNPEIPLFDKISKSAMDAYHSDQITKLRTDLMTSLQEDESEDIEENISGYSNDIATMALARILPFFGYKERWNDFRG